MIRPEGAQRDAVGWDAARCRRERAALQLQRAGAERDAIAVEVGLGDPIAEQRLVRREHVGPMCERDGPAADRGGQERCPLDGHPDIEVQQDVDDLAEPERSGRSRRSPNLGLRRERVGFLGARGRHERRGERGECEGNGRSGGRQANALHRRAKAGSHRHERSP